MKTNRFKPGNLIWMGIKGPSLDSEEKKVIQSEEISGIILFKRNIVSLLQVYELCREIKSLKPSPLIIIDREGGRVDRLRHLLNNALSWPSPKQLAKHATLREIKQISFLMNRELKYLSVDINLAPCVDVEQVKSQLFKDRLLGFTPKDVIQRSSAFLSGINQAGICPCIKHFPGHGGVREDSHLLLPVDTLLKTKLYKNVLPVFQQAISKKVSLIMVAHVLYIKWDSKWPATFSKIILTNMLKNQMKFRGLLVSDDLDMKALSCFIKKKAEALEFSPKKQIALWALKAGIDILLYGRSNLQVFSLPAFFHQLAGCDASLRQEFSSKINRIIRFKKQILKNRREFSFKSFKNIINSPPSCFFRKKFLKKS